MKNLKEHTEVLVNKLGLYNVAEIMVKASFVDLIVNVEKDLKEIFNSEEEQEKIHDYFTQLCGAKE